MLTNTIPKSEYNREKPYEKNTKIIIITIVLYLLTGFFRPIINEFIPDVYIAKLIRKSLQALVIILIIIKLKYWNNIGITTKASKKHLLLLLPIILISLIPLSSGIRINTIDTMFILLIISLLTGIIEELLFRGIIFSALQERGKMCTIIVSSVLFGLSHLLNLINGADILETIIQIIFAFGLGLVFAVVRYRKGSLISLILVHALWDFIMDISNPNFPAITDNLHSIGLTLIVVWGIYLTFKVSKNKTDYLRDEIGS